KERIDFYNGLLLCPAHNAAFDGGYITFDNTGTIVISNLLNKQNMELLKLNENTKILLESNHLYYMDWHINNVFKHK
ncbi:HNH endonuclease, partial [Bacillus sp. D-CC]